MGAPVLINGTRYKSTVMRAIKAGKISGTKDEHGEWHIEAAEQRGDAAWAGRPRSPLAANNVASDRRKEFARGLTFPK
jgi:hypothetical protein